MKLMKRTNDSVEPTPPLEPVKQFLRGICMGAADVVPGVSGGTVAFLLGIYQRLIHAVSRLDLICLGMLLRGRWREAIVRADLQFLAALGGGIACGILSTATTVHHLLSSDRWRAYTLAVFFGAILASGVIVARQSWRLHERWRSLEFGVFSVAIAAAAVLAMLPHGMLESPPYWYFFVGGSIAICAMLLPGISGAMILLLFGLYGHLTGIPEALVARENLPNALTTLVVFGLGCATGLAGFSRLLRWLLQHHIRPTLAALCGLMFGSLPKLWPYQIDLSPDVEKFEHKELRPTLPAVDQLSDLLPLVTIIVVALLVWSIHGWLDRKAQDSPARTS